MYASKFTLCAINFWVLTNAEYHVPITKLLHRIVLFSKFSFLQFFQRLFLILPNTDIFTISIAMLFAIFYINSMLPFQTGFFHLTIYIYIASRFWCSFVTLLLLSLNILNNNNFLILRFYIYILYLYFIYKLYIFYI